MLKRIALLLLVAAIVAVPFALRPAKRVAERTDDTVIVLTANNEAVRREIGAGFARWYREKTGRTVSVDWRVIGGTSDIARFLDAAYTASFRLHWTRDLQRSWTAEVQAAFASARSRPDASAVARDARREFLASSVGCGMDVFFGGGSYDFVLQAGAGRIVPTGVIAAHPEWFRDEVIPQAFSGEEFWDRQARWVGNVLSNYGILFNRDALARLGISPPPQQWTELCDPRYAGQLALADPTKSSSMAKAFENILQQQMQRALNRRAASADNVPAEHEREAVREGWIAGLRVIQLIGANARYFTDAAQKIPTDVAQGDCAAGICIDFYGRSQAQATAERSGRDRLGFITPAGGTVSSVDPIALLRGAPHRAVAEALIEYTLTLEGQKRWNFRAGVVGGPQEFALRRLPVRRDFYAHEEWKPLRSDPEANPFADTNRLVYRPQWTGNLFREMELLERVMLIDTHDELTSAWRALQHAPEPRRSRALAVLQDMSAVEYDAVPRRLTAAVTSHNKVDEVATARDLGAWFRSNYRRAEAIARGTE